MAEGHEVEAVLGDMVESPGPGLGGLYSVNQMMRLETAAGSMFLNGLKAKQSIFGSTGQCLAILSDK